MNMDMESMNVTDMDLRLHKNPGVQISTLSAFKSRKWEDLSMREYSKHISRKDLEIPK